MIDTNETSDKTKDKESFQNTNGNRVIIIDGMAVVNKLKKDDSIKTCNDINKLHL